MDMGCCNSEFHALCELSDELQQPSSPSSTILLYDIEHYSKIGYFNQVYICVCVCVCEKYFRSGHRFVS